MCAAIRMPRSSTIIERYKAVEGLCDAVVIVGSDYTDVGSPAELGYNARIAANLGAPVLLVLSGRAGQGEQLGTSPARTPGELGQIASLALTELVNGRAGLLAVIANRVDPEVLADSVAAVQSVVDAAHLPERPSPDGRLPVWALPEDRYLVAPAVRDVMRTLDATFTKGDDELLSREVLGVVIAGMSMVNALPRLLEGSLVIIPADRTEVLLAALLAHRSGTFPSLSGIVLNGPFPLPDDIDRLIDGTRGDASDPLDRPRHLRDGADGDVDARAPRRRLPAALRHGARDVRDPRRHRGAGQLARGSRRPPS